MSENFGSALTASTAIDRSERSFSRSEVASHLQVTPDLLFEWNERFGHLLAIDPESPQPRYTSADVAVLLAVQRLLDQGLDDDQIHQQLTPKRLPLPNLATEITTAETALMPVDTSAMPQVVADLLSTIASSQQTVLNSQSTVREIVNVVVQDNFNLKDENRKLRDRMLEMERTLAEYQRREETRKERLEGRVRGLEQTVSALQQQVAQVVGAIRQQRQPPAPRRRGWFG